MQQEISNYIFRELLPEEDFNPIKLNGLAQFTQADFYGKWQANLGKEVRRFLISNGNSPLLYMQIIKCKLPLGKIFYTCPYGPIYKDGCLTARLLEFLKQNLQNILKTRNTVFTRLNFSPAITTEQDKLISNMFTSVHWTSTHATAFQPQREWFLPLHKSEEQILANMHQKTRYNIRLAERRGIVVDVLSSNFTKYIDTFYDLQSITAKRNGFNLHSKEYYKSVLEYCEQDTNSYLAVARLGDQVLTMNLVVVYGEIAMFVFGGSSNEHRNLMPSYLTHWVCVKHAKSLGMRYYNFGGYFDKNGPRVKQATLKKRSQYSVFKRKFGGFAFEHSNPFDLVHNRQWYTAYILYKFFRHV